MTPHDDIGSIRRLDRLAERARADRPRLFALYGHRGEREILGWGMDFTGRDDALLYLPADSSTHHTNSAERVARRFGALGDIRLTWFDE